MNKLRDFLFSVSYQQGRLTFKASLFQSTLSDESVTPKVNNESNLQCINNHITESSALNNGPRSYKADIVFSDITYLASCDYITCLIKRTSNNF